MLIDRLAQAHLTIQHEVPQTKAEVEVPLERRLQERVVRRSVDKAVDLLVQLHQVALVGHPAALQQLQQLAHRLAVGGRDLFGGEPGRVGLEHDPHLRDAGEVRDVDVGDECAPMGDGADEVLSCQALQRLADGCAADLEVLGRQK